MQAPPSTWSELSAQLEGLLDRLAAPWTAEGGQQFAAESEILTAAPGVLPPPAQDERQQLSRWAALLR